MAKTLYRTIAAALLCGAVGFAGPTFAATHIKAIHHAKHAVFSSKSSDVDRMERQITAELNRAALAKATHDEIATVIIPNMVASTDIDDDDGE